MAIKFDLSKVKWGKNYYGLPQAYYFINESESIKLKTPSVTTIINECIPDPEFEAWIQKMGQEKVDAIMQAAAYRGTAMHLFIENFLRPYSKYSDVSKALRLTQEYSPAELKKDGVPDNKIDEGRDLFYKFYYSDYANHYNNLLGLEIPLYSNTSFFRGKADVFFKDRIYGNVVTDFKTSSGFIKKGSTKEFKYKCQLGGYSLALEEMYNMKINRSSILCINTKSDNLQHIICEGAELKEFKSQFKTFSKEWHINNNQSQLINY